MELQLLLLAVGIIAALFQIRGYRRTTKIVRGQLTVASPGDQGTDDFAIQGSSSRYWRRWSQRSLACLYALLGLVIACPLSVILLIGTGQGGDGALILSIAQALLYLLVPVVAGLVVAAACALKLHSAFVADFMATRPHVSKAEAESAARGIDMLRLQ